MDQKLFDLCFQEMLLILICVFLGWRSWFWFRVCDL